MDATQHDDDDTPGWNALNAALAALYPGQEPKHFGTGLPYTLGGQDPLDGISVYWSDALRPHWHYVTYGFSELYAKESEDLEESGFGFELTFRLAAAPGEGPDSTPPTWPMSLLQNLARYVFKSGNGFEHGHHLDANGPIALDTGTALCHLAFVEDPQLPPRATANGQVRFLQLVGLTDDEMRAIKRWSANALLQLLEPAMPLWITDLDRGSLLDDPERAAAAAAGSAREGSTTGMLFVDALEWTRDGEVVELVLGAGKVPSVLELLPARLPHGNDLSLLDRDHAWTFQPGVEDAVVVSEDAGRVVCTLSPATLQRLLDDLRPQRGVYALSSGLRIRVAPTDLRDAQGAVVRTIG